MNELGETTRIELEGSSQESGAYGVHSCCISYTLIRERKKSSSYYEETRYIFFLS